ncbi:MAG: hypothetical protein U0M15_00325 [Bacillota bacterium]|nr:hypothetical protein [Bacillota bacterium]
MKKYQRLLQKIRYPRGIYLILLLFFSGIALPTIFIQNAEQQPFAYAVYMISAYTTFVMVLRITSLIKSGRALVHRNQFLHKYFTDLDFKAEVSLYLSLTIDIFYSVYTGLTGIFHHSIRFGAMAFYYLILSAERFLLLHHQRTKRRDRIREFKQYRFCGYLMLILTLSIIGINCHIIYEGKVMEYPGYMIYAVAGYTFYNFALAIINIIKYKKLKNPIFSASKIITFVTALVSIFVLQTAMLAAFGYNAPQDPSDITMNLWTGFGVFTLTLSMALFMIIHGSLSIARLAPK